MPVSTLQSAGDYAVAAAHSSKALTLSILSGVTVATDGLVCTGMPRVRFWLRQTAGLIGATFIPQFAVDAATGGLAPVPNWKDLQPVQLLPVPALPGDAVELEFDALTATQVRLLVTAPVQLLTTVDCVIAASE